MLSLLRCSTDEARLTPDGGPAFLSSPVASLCRLATGRSALFHLTKRLPAGHVRAVLMPCYVPEGVIQPFTAAGFERVFYRLRADLTPSVDHVERLLSAIGSGAVFMRIHYFGYPTIDASLDDVLTRYACIVVDDLAHAPFAVRPDGARLIDHAQVALFSLNKFLPVADGAILASRRHDIDVAIPEASLPDLPHKALEAYQAHLRSGRELFATNDPELARTALRRLGEEYETYYACINSDLTPHRQSARSREVEARFPFGDLVASRVRNTAIVYSGLRNELFSLVHPTLPAGLVPFGIPARVPAGRRREICSRLLERGLVLSTLQDKWDFVPRDRRAGFPVESAFLDDHVLIPVSETIGENAMRAAVATLNDFELPD